jgi:hypothetical protein
MPCDEPHHSNGCRASSTTGATPSDHRKLWSLIVILLLTDIIIGVDAALPMARLSIKNASIFHIPPSFPTAVVNDDRRR